MSENPSLFDWAKAPSGAKRPQGANLNDHEEEAENAQQRIFSVSDIARILKTTIEDDDLLGMPFTVQGELSNVKIASSGHVYFTLKDENAGVSAIMWASSYKALKFKLEPGLDVLATGQLQVYEKQGTVSFICKKMIPAGLGALQLALEALKQKLQEEGLFDDARKRPLPQFPRQIGLITAQTGAVIHDMRRVFERKHPQINLLLYPVAVQGDNAPPQIIAALRELNDPKYELDLLLLARGGGSFEDLFCFNDEGLVRAIAASRLPVLTGLGHEPDFSLADAVADFSASTPTAAAEIAVPDTAELLGILETIQDIFIDTLERWVLTAEKFLDDAIEALPNGLRHTMAAAELRLSELQPALLHSMASKLQTESSRFEQLAAALDTLSPLKTLSRGYALVTDTETGHVLSSVEQLKAGQRLQTQFPDGHAISEVISYDKK